MPGKCVFNPLWVFDKRYSMWLEPSLNRYKACCSLCRKEIDVCNMGEAALKHHMRGKKHTAIVNAAVGTAGFVIVTNDEKKNGEEPVSVKKEWVSVQEEAEQLGSVTEAETDHPAAQMIEQIETPETATQVIEQMKTPEKAAQIIEQTKTTETAAQIIEQMETSETSTQVMVRRETPETAAQIIDRMKTSEKALTVRKRRQKRKFSEEQPEGSGLGDVTTNCIIRDEFVTYGDYVGNEIRKLLPTAQVHVKHLINDILYKAALGEYNNPSNVA